MKYVTFGQRLRALREKNKKTQKDLAKLFQLAESTVSMYERDEREPNIELINKIADYFNVPADYLLGRTDDPKPYAITTDDLVEGKRVKLPVLLENDEPYTLTEKTERELLLEELEQYGNLAFEGGGEDLSDEELREIVEAMREAAEDAAKRTLNLINKFKK